MMKILKNKKSLMSVGTILVAMALIAGATFAWFELGGTGAGGSFQAGELGIDFDLSMIAGQPVQSFQPGYEIEEDGSIKNTGNIAGALLLEPTIEVTINSDANGKALPAGSEYVLAADKNGILFGFTVKGDQGGNYINDYVSYNAYLNSLAAGQDPGPATFHWVLTDNTGKILKHLLVMDEGAELEADTKIDMYTYAKYDKKTDPRYLDNKYMNADIVVDSGWKYTQANYVRGEYLAIKEVLGIDLNDPNLRPASFADGENYISTFRGINLTAAQMLEMVAAARG